MRKPGTAAHEPLTHALQTVKRPLICTTDDQSMQQRWKDHSADVVDHLHCSQATPTRRRNCAADQLEQIAPLFMPTQLMSNHTPKYRQAVAPLRAGSAT